MTVQRRRPDTNSPCPSAGYRREYEAAASDLVRDIKSSLIAWLWAILGGVAAILWLVVTQGNWRLRAAIGIGLVLVAVLLGRLVERLQQKRATT